MSLSEEDTRRLDELNVSQEDRDLLSLPTDIIMDIYQNAYRSVGCFEKMKRLEELKKLLNPPQHASQPSRPMTHARTGSEPR
jgi:hypothetical protein